MRGTGFSRGSLVEMSGPGDLELVWRVWLGWGVGWRSGIELVGLSLRSWEKWGMVTQSLLHLARSSVGTGSEAPGVCGAS